MATWTDVDKLKYIISAALVGIAALAGYWHWQQLPDLALVPGQTQVIDHTVGAILRNRIAPSRYRVFAPRDYDAALAGGTLHFTGSTALSDIELSATTGRVKWRNGRFDSHDVPGLRVRVRATMRVADSLRSGVDTLVLRLPGLSRLADENREDPLISYNGGTPRWGDSVIMGRYVFYPSVEAMQRGRIPYLAFAVVMGIGFVLIAVRAIRRTMRPTPVR